MTPELKAFLSKRMDEHIYMIPGHMRQSIRDYVLEQLPPGGFLTAVLENDFKGAVSKADHINKLKLVEWAQFMMWAMPSGAQGSPEKVEAWLNQEREVAADQTTSEL